MGQKRRVNMKRFVLFALLLFCSRGLFAEAQRPKAMTPLLMAIEQAGASGLADLPASLGTPAPQQKDGVCSANLTCPVTGCPIACGGMMTCSVGSNSVTCDGNTTPCPYQSCAPLVNCIDPCGYCQCRAGSGGQHFCAVSYCFDN
jgi:hypothetical protein